MFSQGAQSALLRLLCLGGGEGAFGLMAVSVEQLFPVAKRNENTGGHYGGGGWMG